MCFWCENTCHVGSPDLSSNRTCPWNWAHGAPMASILVELAPDQDLSPALDVESYPRLDQGRLRGLVSRLPQSQGTDKGLIPASRI
jgi:hypothetical protein